MSIEKVKKLLPAMEKFVKVSEIDGMERGFTFRIDKKAEIEEFCHTGTKCEMIMKDIKKKEGTKTGNFHTHPRTTRKTKKTYGIAEIFSCPDILFQVDHGIDHSCVGNKEEITCSTLKSKIPEDLRWKLLDCSLFHKRMIESKQEKGYKGSEMEKDEIKLLDKLEKDLDNKLRPYMNFEIIKKL